MIQNSISGVKTNLILLVSALFLLSVLNPGCKNNKEEILYAQYACDTVAVTYSASIVPLIQANCISCHSGNLPADRVKLDEYAKVKVQVDSGNLWGVVTHSANYPPMPRYANQLSDCNLAKIRLWIAAGAPNN